MRIKKWFPFIIMVILMLSTVTTTAQEIKVVAATAWSAAFVQAAGIEEVYILAPLEYRHPPEYDFKPSDILTVLEADYLVWGGYEPFISKLVEASGFPSERVIKVNTVNLPSTIKEEVPRLAAIFKTEEKALSWLGRFNALENKLLEKAQEKQVSQIDCVVQFHLQAMLSWLGYNVIGVYGGLVEVTPVLIADMISKGPEMVIDNWHNPQGQPISEALNVPYVQLINFPGRDGTLDLLDVFEYNARILGLIE
jgi:zinc transport system substrate-binding protein